MEELQKDNITRADRIELEARASSFIFRSPDPFSVEKAELKQTEQSTEVPLQCF